MNEPSERQASITWLAFWLARSYTPQAAVIQSLKPARAGLPDREASMYLRWMFALPVKLVRFILNPRLTRIALVVPSHPSWAKMSKPGKTVMTQLAQGDGPSV